MAQVRHVVLFSHHESPKGGNGKVRHVLLPQVKNRLAPLAMKNRKNTLETAGLFTFFMACQVNNISLLIDTTQAVVHQVVDPCGACHLQALMPGDVPLQLDALSRHSGIDNKRNKKKSQVYF